MRRGASLPAPHAEKVAKGRASKAAYRKRELKLTETQERYVENSKAMYRAAFLKFFTAGGTAQQAIRLKCLDCVGQEDAHNRVRCCDISICALWRFRPFQTPHE